MAYWMLVVSPSAACPSEDVFQLPLYSDFAADYDVRKGTEADWQEVELFFTGDDDGDGESEDAERDPKDDFATVFRKTGEAAVREEIDGLIEELEGVLPKSGATWVAERLREGKTVYSFTPHHNDRKRARAALGAVMEFLARATSGITYAEGEGWSNHAGSQVTWEFDHERHTGQWVVAVLDGEGRWSTFRMQLENPDHRNAFREGHVPDGIRSETK